MLWLSPTPSPPEPSAWSKSRFDSVRHSTVKSCPPLTTPQSFMSFLWLAVSSATSAFRVTHLNSRVGQQPKEVKGGKVDTLFSIHHNVVGWRAGEDGERFISAPIWARDSRHSTAVEPAFPSCSPPLSFVPSGKSENGKLKVRHLPISSVL